MRCATMPIGAGATPMPDQVSTASMAAGCRCVWLGVCRAGRGFYRSYTPGWDSLVQCVIRRSASKHGAAGDSLRLMGDGGFRRRSLFRDITANMTILLLLPRKTLTLVLLKRARRRPFVLTHAGGWFAGLVAGGGRDCAFPPMTRWSISATSFLFQAVVMVGDGT
ncbi:hypothetical protein KCP70_15060 [Salmonella enterica subsp. enterica]|nr:hypothetical protein KCP70_15060 [Salmonella enterica subsp. enterica]